MRRLWMIVLAISAVATGASPRQQPPASTERPIGFTKWLPFVVPNGDPQPQAGADTLVSTKNYTTASVAVDSRDNAHLVQANFPPFAQAGAQPVNFVSNILYRNTRYSTRSSNGFSAPVVLDSRSIVIPAFTTPGSMPLKSQVLSPAVAIDPSDTVHVVWVGTTPLPNPPPPGTPGFSFRYDIFYRKLDTSGWSSIFTLTPAQGLVPNVVAANPSVEAYSNPRIKVGRSGAVHILVDAAHNEVDAVSGVSAPTFPNTDPNGGPADYATYLVHLTPSGVAEVVPGTVYLADQANHNFVTGGALADWAVDNSGNVFVVWQQQQDPTGTFGGYSLFTYSNFATWGTKSTYTGILGSSAYDSMNNRHTLGHGQYQLNGGAVEAVGGSGSVEGAITVIDSRDQPHGIFISPLAPGAIGHCARIPLQGQSSPWQVELFSVGGYNTDVPRSAVISTNDTIHVVSGKAYTRTLDYGLGVRDPAAMTGVFPGASVNVTNGNLLYRLPLFSTQGVGPTQSCDLIYNSNDARDGYLGRGWKFNYEMYLIDHRQFISNQSITVRHNNSASDDFITLFMPDGRPIPFLFEPQVPTDPQYNYFVAQQGNSYFSRIERTVWDSFTTEYKLTTKFGELYWFNSQGKLRKIEDLTGNAIELSYDSSGNLVQVTDMLGNGGSGRTSTIAYSAGDAIHDGRAQQVTDPGGSTYLLSYTGGQLSSATLQGDSTQPTYSFEYGAANNASTGERTNRIKRFVPPRGQPAVYGWTCRYLPDGRLIEVDDPAEVYLLESEQDSVQPTAHTATLSLTYTDFSAGNNAGTQFTLLLDRRGFRTQFTRSATSFLVFEIDDEAFLQGAPGISPVVRTFDTANNVSAIQDRWGFTTRYTHDLLGATPTHVQDNLLSVTRPNAVGTGSDLVANYTYTTDGLNRIATATTYATPADGSSPRARTTTYTYNNLGQLLQTLYPDVLRPDGVLQATVTTTYEWNGPRLQLSHVANEEGHSTFVSSFDGLTGLPTAVLREGGTQLYQYTYDIMGNLAQQLMPAGAGGNTAPGPTIYGRDGLYRIITVTDPKGMITSLGYDLESHQVQVQPPAGNSTTTAYDQRGFVSGGTTPDGSWSQVVDAEGNIRRSLNLRGFASNSYFDFMGRTLEAHAQAGSTLAQGGGGGPSLQVTQFTYDSFDGTTHFSTMTEIGASTNRTTTTQFDARGRAKAALAPDGQTQTQTVYDEQDQVVAQQLIFGATVQTCSVTFRDARDRVEQVRQQDVPYGGTLTANKRSTFTLYNRVGSVILTVDPLGDITSVSSAHKTTYIRDARERVQLILDGKGSTVRENVYGDDDLLSEILQPDPMSKSTALVPLAYFSYTERKELLQALDGNHNGMSYSYGSLPHQLSMQTDPLNIATQVTYDPATQRADTVIEAQGTADENRTKQVWTNGLLTQTQVFNPETQLYNSVFQRSYDQANRLERMDAPQVAAEQYFYNSFNEPSQFTAGTKTITHTYNNLGQRTLSAWSGAYTNQISRTFNGAGLLQSLSDGTRSRAMTYDLWKGSPKNETFAVGGAPWKTQTHAEDNAGNYVDLVDPESAEHQWPVDENNRPTEIRYGDQGVCAMTYTPGGLLDQMTLKSASGQVIATTIHTYDSLGRPAGSQTVQAGTNLVLSDYAWQYDVRHQVTTVSLRHLGADFAFTHDGRLQTSGETTLGNAGGQSVPPFTNNIGGPATGNESIPSSEASGHESGLLAVPARSTNYTYHPSGNRTIQTINGVITTLAYNSANQLVSEIAPDHSVTHQYDQWGNEAIRTTTTGTGPSAQTTTEAFGYNYLNLLSSYTNSATGANWQYDFWPSGERYGKTDLNAQASQLYVPRFGDVVTEYSQQGGGPITLQNSYVQGTGIDSKWLRIAAGGAARSHLVGDLVGTVGMTLDDTGSPIDTSVKDSWGLQLAGGTSERFAGLAQRELDAESGLVFVRRRMYDPRLGRFTQTDPIAGNKPTEHYSYAGNNPVGRTDPMGEYWTLSQGPGATAMLSDLQKFTGRRITVDASGHVWFAGEKFGKEYASSGDMKWIWSGQNDTAENDIGVLWRHLTGGDEWHRERFKDAWLAYSGQETPLQAFDRGGAAGWEGFKEGATFGVYQAPDWARKTEGFNISRGIGMATTSVEVGLSGVGLAAGTFEAGAGATLYNGLTVAGTSGGIPLGLIEAGGGLALYGAATSNSSEAPNPQIALQMAAVPVMNGMMQHFQSGSGPNWRSTKLFGHTFLEHGAQRPSRELIDRARGTGNPQGQWVDNDKAAEFLAGWRGKLQGPSSTWLPAGLGRVFRPDGSTVEATHVTIVPGPNGQKTAYPTE